MPDIELDELAELTRIVLASPLLRGCLEALGEVGLWIGAGAITQTVWNTSHGYRDGHGIRDLDVVYFDADRSEAAESAVAQDVARRLAGCGRMTDVKNQARVHEWYPVRFGHGILPYLDLPDAVASWPSTASAIAVRMTSSGLQVIAPFGLTDLCTGVVRANRIQVPEPVFAAKAARWRTTWPQLHILPWAQGIGRPAARWR